MAAYRRVYGFSHLRADCRGLGSVAGSHAHFKCGTTFVCLYTFLLLSGTKFSAVSKDILEILSQELDTGVYRNNNSYNLPEPHPPKK